MVRLHDRLADALLARQSDECVYARELSNGKKNFFTTTRKRFIERYNVHFTESTKSLLLYECITGPCLFFIDVDGCSDIHEVLRWVRRFGTTFRVYHAPPKASWHIRGALGSKVYATIYELKEEIQRAEPPPDVDMSVYTKRRLLRCVGSTKWGEERPLIPWDPFGDRTTVEGGDVAPFSVSLSDLVALPGDIYSKDGSTNTVSKQVPKSRSTSNGSSVNGVPERGRKRARDVVGPLQYFMAKVPGHSPYVGRSVETLDGDSMTIFVDSRDCAIAGRKHRSNRIFFMVSGERIEQRCFKCAGSFCVL